LLKEVFPRLSRVGVLLPSDSPSNPGLVQALQDATRSVKTQLQIVEATSSADFERAMATLVKERVDALIVTDQTVFVAEAKRISRLANANHLPVIGFVEIADTGGLMGYGVDFPVLWHRAASFVDKILKGTKPGDLPVEQPMKFEIVINLKAAKALGIMIPNSLRVRANRIID
jgi:putative tryptophan/tyrosine transport system substrate-binding protein